MTLPDLTPQIAALAARLPEPLGGRRDVLMERCPFQCDTRVMQLSVDGGDTWQRHVCTMCADTRLVPRRAWRELREAGVAGALWGAIITMDRSDGEEQLLLDEIHEDLHGVENAADPDAATLETIGAALEVGR